MKAKIFLATILMGSFAIAGSKDSGGDPMVQQFIDLGKKLSVYYTENPYNHKLPFKAKDFSSKIEQIDKSVKDEKVRDLVEFTSDKLRDKSGVEKPAVFNSQTGLIRVNRSAWRSFSSEERLIQVTLEISGLLKTSARYEEAQRLVSGTSEKIISIPLANSKGYELPGWRIVGEDAAIFSDMKPTDTFLYGGVLGSGSAEVKKGLRFLDDLKQNQNLMLAIFAAVNNRRPSYIFFESPRRDRASLAAIYVGKTEGGLVFKVYAIYLNLIRQIFKGPCADMDKLTPQVRIQQCYLDLTNYYPQDGLNSAPINLQMSNEELIGALQAILSGYKKDLTYEFAKNNGTMLEALRDHFIVDFSKTMAHPTDQHRLIVAAMSANGLEPSLEGPFQEAQFWIKTGNKEPASVRLYEAGRALAENGLVYLDENISCEGEIPSLRTKSEWLALRKNCAWTRMGTYLEMPLYLEMVNYGFYYDYAAGKWSLDRKEGAKQ